MAENYSAKHQPKTGNKSFVVGLTGGIASGKTTVADLFAKKQITLVDADIVAREVVAIGTPGLIQIAKYFGSTILLESGELNRPKLRELIFADDDNKKWLNNLLHPLIHNELLRQLSESRSTYTLLVAPLLVENNLMAICDHILVVDVAESLQLERTVQRDKVSEAQVKSILASQASREQRLAVADSVIINNGSLSALQSKVDKLHQKFLELAGASVAD